MLKKWLNFSKVGFVFISFILKSEQPVYFALLLHLFLVIFA